MSSPWASFSFVLEVYRKNLPRKFCFPGKEAFSILPYLVFTQQILFDIISQEYNLGFRFQPSLSGAVNLCPAPNLSLTNGSASDVFRVIDLIFTATLSLSLSCSSSSNTWHALQNHVVKPFFYLLVATQYKTLVVPVTVSVVDRHEYRCDWLWCQLAALPK